VFGYFNGLNSPVWDFFATVLAKRGTGREADLEHGQRIQAACVHFADHIQGQKLLDHDVCPVCQSSQVDIWPTESAGIIEVAEVSHTRFMALPEVIRRQSALDFDGG